MNVTSKNLNQKKNQPKRQNKKVEGMIKKNSKMN